MSILDYTDTGEHAVLHEDVTDTAVIHRGRFDEQPTQRLNAYLPTAPASPLPRYERFEPRHEVDVPETMADVTPSWAAPTGTFPPVGPQPGPSAPPPTPTPPPVPIPHSRVECLHGRRSGWPSWQTLVAVPLLAALGGLAVLGLLLLASL